ncbi:GGDEF domain-containing protein [Vibrio sp. J1-1]|uniref:GGDEF domain-containing protein n=1 Tax=Vibrio sp. J1-1 TaxID=2912251 RepID=UPI001F2606EF|nr:GGDEF domain-containing protein [Vibrio sp. J1-1]MCF7480348.1 GGDEF domain-containing protein [Vibrio sp. J1-1]
MEQLLNKVTEAGIDPSSVTGEEAVALWKHIRVHIAETHLEKAHCYIISAEYRRELKHLNDGIAELRQALEHLNLPINAEDILSVKSSLCEHLVENGDYDSAMSEYIKSTKIAVDFGFINEYVLAIVGMGNLCDAYGDHERAMRFYKKIDAIDHAISNRSLRLRYKLYMLACYISLERTDNAMELLTECEELSILVSDKNLAGQIHLYRAKMHQLNNDYLNALLSLSNVQYTSGSSATFWLSAMVKIETAYCLNGKGNTALANLVMASVEKRIKKHSSAMLAHKFYNAMSEINASQGQFEVALECEKRAYSIESELIRQMPISELGYAQLHRLDRYELQLKLILSEIENKELKETTKQHKNTVAQLQQDVLTDPLTSLHNRRWLEGKLKDLLLRDTLFALMVIDIDHFKSINDELSHLVGDKAIQSVSKHLSNYFNFPGASCIRFGGEEFLVILENNKLEHAEILADNYREKIYNYNWSDILGERGLTVSIGITVHREGENTQRTFYRADKALYRAKANGRNQVCTEL